MTDNDTIRYIASLRAKNQRLLRIIISLEALCRAAKNAGAAGVEEAERVRKSIL